TQFVVIGRDREPGGVRMSAAAEQFGDARDVDAVLRPQARADRVIRQFAEEGGGLNIADGQRVIDDAVGVFLARAGLLHYVLRHPDPGDVARLVTLQGRKHRADQLHLAVRVTVEDGL